MTPHVTPHVTQQSSARWLPVDESRDLSTGLMGKALLIWLWRSIHVMGESISRPNRVTPGSDAGRTARPAPQDSPRVLHSDTVPRLPDRSDGILAPPPPDQPENALWIGSSGLGIFSPPSEISTINRPPLLSSLPPTDIDVISFLSVSLLNFPSLSMHVEGGSMLT